MPATAVNDARHVEMILDQLDALPTLGAVGARVLQVTAADDFAAREVIDLIASDPALSSRVLRLCRCSEAGRAHDPRTVAHAANLMGMDAVRCAALSLQVFDVMDGAAGSVADGADTVAGPDARSAHSESGEPGRGGPSTSRLSPESRTFDRAMFWHHCIAVALVSESLVGALSGLNDQGRRRHPPEAFLAGLLHDLGQLALHAVLPRAFDQVCALAEAHACPLDQACRTLIGLDSRAAGQRLARRWNLPEAVVQVISGAPARVAQPGENVALTGVVALADALVRRCHITTTGHGPTSENIDAMTAALRVPPAAVSRVMAALPDELAERAEALGLRTAAPAELLLRCISRANEVLGRMNFLVQQKNVQLAATQSELARRTALASIGEVAAGVAHEMNNPLTVISGWAQLLAGRLQDVELADMAREIAQAATKLTEMISTLRNTAEPCRVDPREFDLAQLLPALAAEIRPRMAGSVQMAISVQPNLPLVWLDRDLLASALRELLYNAIQAPAASEIEVRVQTDAVDDRLMIRVADDGPGLSEHALAHAFDPFFSAKGAGRRSGLGLATVRRIVDAHGGTVTLENRQPASGAKLAPMKGECGGGAVATIWLPTWRRSEGPMPGPSKLATGATVNAPRVKAA